MFVRRSKHANLQARNEHLVRRLAKAREDAAAWRAAALRTSGRNDQLANLLEISRGATSVDSEYAGQLEGRLARALRACVRYRAETRRLERREHQLQQRLDDAVGLTDPALDGRGRWTGGRS